MERLIDQKKYMSEIGVYHSKKIISCYNFSENIP